MTKDDFRIELGENFFNFTLRRQQFSGESEPLAIETTGQPPACLAIFPECPAFPAPLPLPLWEVRRKISLAGLRWST